METEKCEKRVRKRSKSGDAFPQSRDGSQEVKRLMGFCEFKVLGEESAFYSGVLRVLGARKMCH